MCKLGFPFHQIVPTYDENADAFHFTTPIPRFPIDGILPGVNVALLPTQLR